MNEEEKKKPAHYMHGHRKHSPKGWVDVAKKRTNDAWCHCGFRRRGPSHEDGQHHKEGRKETT